MQIIEIIYDLWKAITGISGGVAVIEFLVSILSMNHYFMANRKKSSSVIRYIIIWIALFIMAISGLVGFFFARVPSLRGGIVADAEEKLLDNGLKMLLPVGWERDDVTYSEKVSSHNPDVGTLVLKGTNVTVYPETAKAHSVKVPNVVGLEQDKATRVLADSNLQFQVWWMDDDEFRYGEIYYVKEQSIPEGSVVNVGTVVRIELVPDENESEVCYYTVTSEFLLNHDYIYIDENGIVFDQYKGSLYSYEDVQYRYSGTCMYTIDDDGLIRTGHKYVVNTDE